MVDDQLIAAFLASLQCDQFFTHEKPPPAELNAGMDPDDWDCVLWQPARVAPPADEIAAALAKLGSNLGAKLPPLYERMVSTWRWLEAATDKVVLYPNPPGPGLDSLERKIFNDPVLAGHLIPKGYLPFGRDINVYDPVCFDTRRRAADGDCPIVRFEHEAMLSFDRIGESWELWSSTRAMMVEACGR